MLELMLVLGWHYLQTHNSLSGHQTVVLESGYASEVQKSVTKHQPEGNDLVVNPTRFMSPEGLGQSLLLGG